MTIPFARYLGRVTEILSQQRGCGSRFGLGATRRGSGTAAGAVLRAGGHATLAYIELLGQAEANSYRDRLEPT